MVIETGAMVRRLYEAIEALPFSGQLRLVCRADRLHPQYSILEIYSAAATLASAADILKARSGAASITVFSHNVNELSLIRHADYSFVIGDAEESVREACRYKPAAASR